MEVTRPDELPGEILMEYTLVGGTFAVKAVNTWGLGLISSNREGVKRYFHFDALGSTRALTDSSGNVTDTYEYNAFGVMESSTGTSVNPFRYVGQWGYYDDGAMGSSSGLLLLGVRYYSPAHGRFWSWDPVANLNLYAYVENSATMAMDPSGAGFPWWLFAIAHTIECAFCIWRAIRETEDIPSKEDKRRHCVTACLITSRCGPLCGGSSVVGSEVADIVIGGVPGWDDLAANYAGYTCGVSLGLLPIRGVWWIFSPRPWCEFCCLSLNYGQWF
ncbi:MAG: hypothetical protein KatS3mg015_1056 [Fimbriimonadales bacterium]|nr:MAG: hypothetical protein KatS3mg015_1056 [Fimbriimonadales bacterium]